ncbi:hypothetical protein NKG05_14085 [Oerskovia sp. M15]
MDQPQMDAVARETAEEAIAVARAIDAPDVEADALTTLAVLEVDDADRAAELLATARERAQAAGDLLTEMRCWYNIAANRYYSGTWTKPSSRCTPGWSMPSQRDSGGTSTGSSYGSSASWCATRPVTSALPGHPNPCRRARPQPSRARSSTQPWPAATTTRSSGPAPCAPHGDATGRSPSSQAAA